MSYRITINPGWVIGISIAISVSFFAGIIAAWIGESILGFDRSPISDIMIAILLGMLIANTIQIREEIKKGFKFCATTLLRIGIMLLGIRLSLFGAGKFTLVALPFVLIAIIIGLSVVRILGKKMNLSPQLTGLIAVGTSICGATAIVATAPLIKAKEAEVGYAIACITIFGVVAMFAYPIIGNIIFSDSPESAGLFLGVSIHETAQVAGAGLMYQSQYNEPTALDYATVTKLVRNLCMIAVIPLVGILYTNKNQNESQYPQSWLSMIPWFIIGFAIMSAIRTLGDSGERAFYLFHHDQWEQIVESIKYTAEKFLIIAMSAVGLTTLFSGMREIGIKPFMLGLFAALIVGITGLITILFFANPVISFLS